MGYFPNGTSGELYREEFCERCVNWHDKGGEPNTPGCPIMDLHMLHNYDDSNNPESYLHFLIPRSHDDLRNEQCTMFVERTDGGYDYNEHVVYPADLDRWAQTIEGWLDSGQDAYVYFDNDSKVRAPIDAVSLIARLSQQS